MHVLNRISGTTIVGEASSMIMPVGKCPVKDLVIIDTDID